MLTIYAFRLLIYYTTTQFGSALDARPMLEHLISLHTYTLL